MIPNGFWRYWSDWLTDHFCIRHLTPFSQSAHKAVSPRMERIGNGPKKRLS